MPSGMSFPLIIQDAKQLGAEFPGNVIVDGNLQVKGTTTSAAEGQVGVVTFASDTVGHVPVTISGFSTAQTGDLLDILQVAAGNSLLKIATVSGAGTGLSLTSAAAAGGYAIAVISTGTDEALTVNAKGAGAITIGGVSTGNVILGTAGHTLTVNNTTGNVAVAAGGLTITSGALVVTAGASTMAADAVGNSPLAVNGFSTAQTADLLVVSQVAAGNKILQISTVNNAATGIQITSAAAASGVTLAAISSGASENLVINAKGTTGTVTINKAIALPAAGSLPSGIQIGANLLGYFVGSGAPTFSAPQGSFYVRSDGSSTSTRCYVATSGAGAWTNITTAT